MNTGNLLTKMKIKLRLAYILYWLFPKKFCWADCVSWAYSRRWFGIDSSNGCKKESEGNKTCYCGLWVNGKFFPSLSKDEQEILRNG